MGLALAPLPLTGYRLKPILLQALVPLALVASACASAPAGSVQDIGINRIFAQVRGVT